MLWPCSECETYAGVGVTTFIYLFIYISRARKIGKTSHVLLKIILDLGANAHADI